MIWNDFISVVLVGNVFRLCPHTFFVDKLALDATFAMMHDVDVDFVDNSTKSKL